MEAGGSGWEVGGPIVDIKEQQGLILKYRHPCITRKQLQLHALCIMCDEYGIGSDHHDEAVGFMSVSVSHTVVVVLVMAVNVRLMIAMMANRLQAGRQQQTAAGVEKPASLLQ